VVSTLGNKLINLLIIKDKKFIISRSSTHRYTPVKNSKKGSAKKVVISLEKPVRFISLPV